MATKTSFAHGEFCWVDLNAHNMEAAKDFYSRLFGWECVTLQTQGGPPYAQFQCQGQPVGGIGQMSDEMLAAGIPPMWNSYVNVRDIEAVAAKAAALGGQVTVPAMQALEYGWLAFIQDPTGGQLGLWQAGTHRGAGLVGSPGAFCWNELATRDIEQAKDFFGALFGWQYADNPGPPTKYYIIKNDGRDNGGLIQMNEQWGDVPPHWGVYFSVANADATAEKVTQLGGNVCAPPFDVPIARLAVLTDPQGAVFYIAQLKSSTA